MKRRVFFLLSIFGGFLLLGQEADRTKVELPVGGRTLIINSDHFESFREEEGLFRPYGNVEVFWDQFRLRADFLEIDTKKQRLLAEGRVTFSDPTSLLSGEQFQFDIETQTGQMTDAFGLFSPFLKAETAQLLQTDPQTLRFRKMTLTSCSQPTPHWRFTCRDGRIVKDRFVEMKDVVLRVLGIPVFYFPYLRYPIANDGKQTGFLFPGIGKSRLLGTTVSPSFFWNIRSNLDLTINADYYERLGIGLGQEWRYLFRHANGNVRFFYLLPGMGVKDNPENLITQKDIERLKSEKGKNFLLDIFHQQEIPFLHSRLTIETRLPGNPEVLRYLDKSFETRNLMSFNSSASWATQIAQFSLQLEASRFQTYNIHTRESEIHDILPSFSLAWNRQKLGPIPGTLSLLAAFDRQIRTGVSQTIQPDFNYGPASQRFRIEPSYHLDLLQTSWVKATVDLKARNLFYSRSWNPKEEKQEDKMVSLTYQTAEIAVTGPSLSRTYIGKKSRLKHTIEPRFYFQYATTPKNSERIIPIDYSDFPLSSTASFSLRSTLFIRPTATADAPTRQLLTFELGQRYYLDPEKANWGLMINGKYPQFSGLNGSIGFAPWKDVSLHVNGEYNYYIHDFSRMSLTLNLSDPKAVIGGNIGYGQNRSPFGDKTHPSYFSVAHALVRLKIPGFPIHAQAQAEYNFRDGRISLCTAQANLDLQCLTISGNFNFFYVNDQLIPAFYLTLSLGNLGMGTPFFKE